MKWGRVSFTPAQRRILNNVGLVKVLGVNMALPSMVITPDDCRFILSRVPDAGRSTRAIRRKTHALLCRLEESETDHWAVVVR